MDRELCHVVHSFFSSWDELYPALVRKRSFYGLKTTQQTTLGTTIGYSQPSDYYTCQKRQSQLSPLTDPNDDGYWLALDGKRQLNTFSPYTCIGYENPWHGLCRHLRRAGMQACLQSDSGRLHSSWHGWRARDVLWLASIHKVVLIFRKSLMLEADDSWMNSRLGLLTWLKGWDYIGHSD